MGNNDPLRVSLTLDELRRIIEVYLMKVHNNQEVLTSDLHLKKHVADIALQEPK